MSDITCAVKSVAGAGAVSQLEPECCQRKLERHQQGLEEMENVITGKSIYIPSRMSGNP